MLSGLKGILQTDGCYMVYESLYGNHPDILLTFYIVCLDYLVAHSRRYFVNLLRDDANQANYVLDETQLLYALEQRMRSWTGRNEERREKRIPFPFCTGWKN
jgi:hypothetical protein